MDNPTIFLDIFGLYLHRPYIRNWVVEAAAGSIGDRFVDANDDTLPIPGDKKRPSSLRKGKYDLGHRKGSEFQKMKEVAEKKGLTQKQFNDQMNDPKHYQVEHPSENRSHKHEAKRSKSKRPNKGKC